MTIACFFLQIMDVFAVSDNAISIAISPEKPRFSIRVAYSPKRFTVVFLEALPSCQPIGT